MQIGKLCTRDVVTVRRSVTLLEAARVMRDRHVGTLVVIDADTAKPIGIITDRDIVVGFAGVDPERVLTTCVGDVLARTVVVANQSDDVDDVLYRMQRHSVRRLPVVDPSGRLTGIVTLDDVLSALAAELSTISALVKYQPVLEGARTKALA